MKRSDYEKFKDQVEAFKTSYGIEKIKPLKSEPFKSSYSCVCCGDYNPGTRHKVHAYRSNKEIMNLQICTKCLHYLEHGKLDEQTMSTMEEDTLARAIPNKKKTKTNPEPDTSFIEEPFSRPIPGCDCDSCRLLRLQRQQLGD